MLKNRSGRGGFTLPEVLVTVAIVAILAAAVVPTVTQQITKGDTGQFTATTDGLRTGITSYVADVRRYPRFLTQLIDAPSAGDSTIVPLGELSQVEADRWNGPYVQSEFTVLSGLELGLGLTAGDTVQMSDDYLSLRINADSAAVDRADELIDNADGSAAGFLRWVAGATRGDSAIFRLMVAK